jgi:hypothetical protein
MQATPDDHDLHAYRKERHHKGRQKSAGFLIHFEDVARSKN